MTVQHQILKWFNYGLALLPLWFLEVVLLRRVPVFGVFPMLLPLAVVAVAVLEGPIAGSGFGLAVGILCDVAYYGSDGSMIIGLALVGAGTGLVAQYGLHQNFWGYLLCSCAALTTLDLLRVLIRLFLGTASLIPLLRVAVPEVLLSLAFTPVVYLIIHLVYRRVGGTTLM